MITFVYDHLDIQFSLSFEEIILDIIKDYKFTWKTLMLHL